MTNTENTQSAQTTDPNAGAADVKTPDAPEVTPEAAKEPTKAPAKRNRSTAKSTSTSRSTTSERKTSRSTTVSDAQHVVIRQIEGGHVTRTADGGYALPANVTEASVKAVIDRGLAADGPDDRSVMLTDAGREYLAGRSS